MVALDTWALLSTEPTLTGEQLCTENQHSLTQSFCTPPTTPPNTNMHYTIPIQQAKHLQPTRR